MKIVVTADLHYDITRSRGPTQRLAEKICHEGGHVLVLVGDSAGADLRHLRDCLHQGMNKDALLPLWGQAPFASHAPFGVIASARALLNSRSIDGKKLLQSSSRTTAH